MKQTLSNNGDVHNTVTCTDDFIFVMQHHPPLVSVYTWSGGHLGDIDHHKLGLTTGDRVEAIRATKDGRIILAVGAMCTVKSVKDYLIQ